VVFLKWPQNQVSMFFSSLLKKGASKTRPVYPLVQDGFKKASKQAGFEKTEKRVYYLLKNKLLADQLKLAKEIR